MIYLLATAIAWAIMLVIGLIALWLFVRFVLPVLLVLGAVSLVTYLGFALWEASQWYHASPTASVAPASSPVPHVTAHSPDRNPVVDMYKFCAKHPNAAACEDRD